MLQTIKQMKKPSLKKYKDKYVSLRDIYRTIRKGLIFSNKQMSYSFTVLIISLNLFKGNILYRLYFDALSQTNLL